MIGNPIRATKNNNKVRIKGLDVNPVLIIKMYSNTVKNMQNTMTGSVKLLQRNIVLFGAPGVGKGTYGKLISKEFNIPAFSMGDYFRKIINEADRNSLDESSE